VSRVSRVSTEFNKVAVPPAGNESALWKVSAFFCPWFTHRPATKHWTDVADYRVGGTRLGPWQRALRPALSPICEQTLLGRRMAPRVDLHMPSRASRSACFAIFVACIDPLIDCLRMTALLAA